MKMLNLQKVLYDIRSCSALKNIQIMTKKIFRNNRTLTDN